MPEPRLPLAEELRIREQRLGELRRAERQRATDHAPRHWRLGDDQPTDVEDSAT